MKVEKEHKQKIRLKVEETGQLSLDIFQNESELIVLAPIAGTKEEDLKITVTKDVLTIEGKRKPKHTPKDEDYFTKECFWGNFSRSIVLPLDADATNITANFEDNVLEIIIPRKTLPKDPKIIKIKKTK